MYLQKSSLNSETLIANLKTYNKVTGILCFNIDEFGETIHSEGEPCEFCIKFKELSRERCTCNQSHLYASKQSEKIGEPFVYFCPSGLVHFATSIVIGGIFRGALIGGPIRMNTSDDFVVEDLIKTYDFPLESRDILQNYVKNVPIVEPDRVRHLAKLLYIISKDIMAGESIILSQRRRFYEEQAAINEEIQNVKHKEYSEHISNYYPVELEKELLSRVKLGDKKGAKIILNELLGHVLFNNGNNIEVTRARVLELMIVLSRAAVEGGGNLEMVFGLNFKYLNEVSTLNNVEKLCEWIIKVLDRFSECVYNLENINNCHIIQKSMEYINDNVSMNISLDSVAEHVYLSPAYFSKLFKKELGINFIDYLNKVRIEESKKYLTNLKISLSDIAHNVGFTDQSYYTKVFKKIEGISPGQYRKMT
ncbi:PocR ligand-binding domain-containing protein [Clostridium bowmanii]|uniref:PocR ligand-binding domain-containing protein n=1 Tax=Clostridium bowmanii TaxID=132925 RepID=UPI001C0B70B9|nr:PocR ligand-binding domain-containing protein [Clostridium bowmanii]MBU3188117.1 PocR ligand-binding domain-containing protein [Clostridium bowmanii]MCA1072298.1 PocR ligand-binding domain-containing protein [Clostridium bowmanii]